MPADQLGNGKKSLLASPYSHPDNESKTVMEMLDVCDIS